MSVNSFCLDLGFYQAGYCRKTITLLSKRRLVCEKDLSRSPYCFSCLALHQRASRSDLSQLGSAFTARYREHRTSLRSARATSSRKVWRSTGGASEWAVRVATP